MHSEWEGSNLYVSGLARTVTEAKLLTLFSHYGPVQSIKIMWPRRSGIVFSFSHFRNNKRIMDSCSLRMQKMLKSQKMSSVGLKSKESISL